MAKTIVGLYDDRATAHAVVNDLESIGFGQDHLRFASNEEGKTTGYDIDATNDASPDSLESYGVANEEARFYSEGVRRGGSLVIARVHDDDVERAVDIMARHNPVRFEDRKEEYLTDYDESADAYDKAQVVENRDRYADQQQQRLQEIEEHIKIGKREVVRGGVRVHQYVDTEMEQETLRLRDEEIRVDRQNVNRTLSPDEANAAFQDKTVEVVERDEEAVVEKTAMVTGEVTVGKDVNVREETVGGEVRRTRVEVEQIAADTFTTVEPEFRKHYDSTYAKSGNEYNTYKPAYEYGYAAGTTYKDRDYNAMDKDLRADYESRHGNDSAWDDVKDAVKHGYNRARAAV
ncbi:YsnF/AvaK domain-containing protein [Rubrivirga sp. S365]|uniref:YsnF/AvaK domain-containing protein n=1 Tax=Rubrivirga litoralis TaxID=3075598 RepID=A0ABU3BSJ8_9BACT|nr:MULTISPECIES: YsnF/AvaK domain-containing protein [unclassified Rubrivirga]MDT0632253.1 YsnF/AvaK domain-containing protein [Rubrivirga sp. F394]MDT7856379.1 YsnF/AvaK domain-containing protein [Rubrivirga sp. S365]